MSFLKAPVKTRADQLRDRHSRQSQQRQSRVVQSTRTAVAVAPITVRGRAGTPVIQRIQSKPRRHYSISLGQGRGEILTPSIPVVKPGWRLLSTFLALLMAALLMLITNTPELNVIDPKLVGAERLSAKDIQAVIHMDGMPIYTVTPATLLHELEIAFPEMTGIQVKVQLPNVVTITFRERQPVISWEEPDETTWIDAEGYMFPPRGEAEVVLTIHSDDNPPLLPHPENDISSASLTVTNKNTGEALDQLPDRVDPKILVAAQKLSEQLGTGAVLVYSPYSGLGWKDPRGWQVFIGPSLEDLDRQLLIYKAVVESLNKQGVQAAIINVEHPDAPYYRLEP